MPPAIADAALAELLPAFRRRPSTEGRSPSRSSPPTLTTPCVGGVPRRAPSRPSWPRVRTRPSRMPGPAHDVFVAGDAVVIDFGATFDGYRSDMTRTFFVGEPPDDELAKVWTVVSESQQAGVEQVGPGVVAAAVDSRLPPAHRRGRLGRAFRARHGPRRRASTSTRHRRSVRGRLLSSKLAPWSPSSPGCTFPAVAGSGSRTPWW